MKHFIVALATVTAFSANAMAEELPLPTWEESTENVIWLYDDDLTVNTYIPIYKKYWSGPATPSFGGGGTVDHAITDLVENYAYRVDLSETLKLNNATLKEEIEDLEDDINGLNNKVKKLNKDKSGLKSQVADLQADIADYVSGKVYFATNGNGGTINYSSYGSALKSSMQSAAELPNGAEHISKRKGTAFRVTTVTVGDGDIVTTHKWFNMSKESGRQKFLEVTGAGSEIGKLAKMKSNSYVFTNDGWSKVDTTSIENKDTNGYTTNELLALAGYTNEYTSTFGEWQWSGPGGKYVNFKTSSKGTIRNLIKKVAHEAYNDGYDDGYEDGYNDGYRDGWYDARSGAAYAGN